MVNDKLFDKNFKSLFYYEDFTATEILSCLDKVLNNYGDDIFRENALAIINRKLSLLIEDVEYYKNSNFDDYDGIENPYENEEYIQFGGFFHENINKLYKEKEIFNLFLDYMHIGDKGYRLDTMLNEDFLNYELLLNLIDSFDDIYYAYTRLYMKYLQNDNFPVNDIYFFKKSLKFTNDAGFLYRNININKEIHIEKYNILKEISNFKDIDFKLYHKNGFLFFNHDIKELNSFKLVCDDFLDINRINRNDLYEFILKNELNTTKNESANYLANIFLKQNNNDLHDYSFKPKDLIWFLKPEYDNSDQKIKINVDFDNSDIKYIVETVGIKDFMVGLSYFDFKDKSKVVNNLYSLYSDEINEMNNILIQENDKNLLEKIERDLKSYLIDEKKENKIIKQKRKLY